MLFDEINEEEIAEAWRDSCNSFCSHGGVCELDGGHEGKHDSRYCQWTDAEALTRDQADEVLLSGDNPNGQFVKVLWDAFIPRD